MGRQRLRYRHMLGEGGMGKAKGFGVTWVTCSPVSGYVMWNAIHDKILQWTKKSP